ncbi:MAG: hypothetical protein Q7S40_06445 [Opitutaceae bacterium]|nr:hypothetical protein [Opitutaceae bacterium]
MKKFYFVITAFALLVIGIWVFFWCSDLGISKDDVRGQFGDKFGALNTLFTGLAFVGLIATLWHERESSNQREKETEKLMRQLERTAVALETQSKLESRARYLTALIARIEGYTHQINFYRQPPGSSGDREQNALLHELDRELRTTRKEYGGEEITVEKAAELNAYLAKQGNR